MKKRVLIIIDGEDDFVKGRNDGRDTYEGKLLVPGAYRGVERLGEMIVRHSRKLDELVFTLDAHHAIGIERTTFYVRASDGAEIPPYTVLDVTPDGKRLVRVDFSTGAPVLTDEEYITRDTALLRQGGVTGRGVIGYVQALAARKRYKLCVWPVHCVIGTRGQCLAEPLQEAMRAWEVDNIASATIVAKGSHPFTEHYSAMAAEVPDPADPSTQIDAALPLIRSFEEYDEIGLCGWARSHCLASTGGDIFANFRDATTMKKIRLLTDATADVPGFEAQGEAFQRDAVARGAQLVTTQDWL